jgi:hypothetical protein
MEVFQLKKDLPVMGFQVMTFPNGIGDAFDSLVSRIEGGFNRAYYGIGFMTQAGKIVYQAAAEVLEPAEPTKYQLESYVIPKGNYLAVTLRDWRKNLHAIKDVFTEITKDNRVRDSPCIEWYKDDDEMVCMVRLNE